MSSDASVPPRTGCTLLASFVIGLSFGDRRLGEEAWFEAESSISPRSRAIEMRGRSTTVMAVASRSIIQAETGTVQSSPPRKVRCRLPSWRLSAVTIGRRGKSGWNG